MLRPTLLYFFFSSLIIFSLFYIILALKLKLSLWLSYLIAINLTLFFLYAYDKTSSRFSFLRVPEFILHFFTFLGGTPLAYLSQKLFSHKTSKLSFQRTFKKIVILQLFLLLSFFGLVFYLS